jgi:hypothetical protein
MKIAYMIQAHKNLQQIEVLITALSQYTPHHCFVHIDKKNELLYKELKKIFEQNRQVHILNNRIQVNWSGFSQVKATLSLMDTVLQTKIPFDRVHLMSGEDFPLKSSKKIETFLTKHRKNEFLHYEDIGQYSWRILDHNIMTEFRYNRTLPLRMIQRLYREVQHLFPKKHSLHHWNLYKGSQWFNISIEAMKYIVKFVKENPDFIKDFTSSACADEHFFHIILLNSPFQKHIINNNLYHIKWHPSQSSPAYLEKKELQDLTKDTNIFFARKVNEQTAIQFYKYWSSL